MATQFLLDRLFSIAQSLLARRSNWRESRPRLCGIAVALPAAMIIRNALPIALIALSLASSTGLTGCAAAVDSETGDSPFSLALPACGQGEAIVSGTVDGAKVEAESAIAQTHAFADARNAGDFGVLDVELATGSRVIIHWNSPMRWGGTVSVAGALEHAGSGESDYATCGEDGFSGIAEFDPETGTVSFHLTDLHRVGVCQGSTSPGEVVGCVGSIGELIPL